MVTGCSRQVEQTADWLGFVMTQLGMVGSP
jgi:hypothetical protein